jgi:sugar phosphate isomerase/epimerase
VKPVSVQLYSLRSASERDFVGVIKSVGKIGYAGVEPAGFYGLKPREFRSIVEGEGMKISSSHGPWTKPENLNEVIDTASELGIDLVAGGYGQDDFKDLDAIKRSAEKTNLMVETLSKAGLTLFLHNHWWEFEKLDGRVKYEIFAELAPRVSFEIDTYWAANFGANDSAAEVSNFRSRTPLLHIKDGPLVRDAPMVALGKGRMDIPAVVAAADPAVLRYLVVELDNCATDMLQALEDSYNYLCSNHLAKGRK